MKDPRVEKERPSPLVDAEGRANSSHFGGPGRGHLKTLQENKGKILQLKPVCQQGRQAQARSLPGLSSPALSFLDGRMGPIVIPRGLALLIPQKGSEAE